MNIPLKNPIIQNNNISSINTTIQNNHIPIKVNIP
jgi:hypothetical protein